MKKIVLIALALSSLSAFSTVLWPIGHSVCLNEMSEVCKEGTELLYAGDGCGCLQNSDYFSPPDFCRRANIRCEEGTEFFSVRKLDRIREKFTPVGCGCFSMFSGMIPN